LGQSALNNASEQRRASGVNGTGVAGIAAAGGVAVAAATATAASGNAAGTKGATSGSLPPATASDQANYHQFEASSTYNAGVGYNVDANGKAVDNCTAWADWRREQLGYATTSGAGGQMAGNAGGSASVAPTLGALGSYYPSDAGTAGHVFVVEGVTSDNPPTIHISEANYAGSPDVHYRDLTQGTDGKWYGQGMGTAGYSIDFSPAG
jgi:surface antigen